MKINLIIVGLIAVVIGFSSCQKGDLFSNPNVAAESSTIPASLILNHLTSNLMKEEEPVISQVYRWNQNIVSNYSYYFSVNSYNWSNTGDTYDNIKYCNLMEVQAQKQLNSTNNVYFALSKFFKAYSFIWMSERVGDIPMSQAGNVNIPNPVYDKQHDVYKNCLALLDTANMIMAPLATGANASRVVDATGDIFGLTYLQWQKVINTYKLRVLISLSKRATDNADLNIPAQFAAIINNATQYPIMTSTKDNLVYKYNSINFYPPNRSGNAPYNACANVSQTFFNVTANYNDPRVYALTTPSLAQVTTGGKTVSDFTAYVGEDNSKSLALMSSYSTDGKYANLNYTRYMSSATGANAEPYVIIGYPELCFTIAEAANLGWVTADAATWYLNGIKSSIAWYGLTQGGTVTVSNNDGTKVLGTASVDINAFLANPNVAYKGGSAGLTQILTQKYVAFFMNSGYESYYNWRRTGVPTFAQGGTGIGTPNNQIPLRWLYPQGEITYNTTNYQSALTAQYGGSDDLTAKMWLIK